MESSFWPKETARERERERDCSIGGIVAFGSDGAHLRLGLPFGEGRLGNSVWLISVGAIESFWRTLTYAKLRHPSPRALDILGQLRKELHRSKCLSEWNDSVAISYFGRVHVYFSIYYEWYQQLGKQLSKLCILTRSTPILRRIL